MKKICFFLICLVNIAISQDREKIVKNFINSLKKNDIVQYSLQYTFTDESKGTTNSSGKCSEMVVPGDTITGTYYNFGNDEPESICIYNGTDFYNYYPMSYGYGNVEVINKKKQPEMFTDRPVNVGGMTGYHPSIARSSQFYSVSIGYLRKLFSEPDIISKIISINDTIINNIDCYQIKIKHRLIALGKKTYLPVCYLMDIGVQQTAAYYTHYTINEVKAKTLFTKNAFPKKFKFSSNIKVIDNYLKAGTVAPDFELTSIKDKRVKLSELKGKNVFLFVTEIGCPPCMQAIPDINQFVADYKDMVFLGLYPLDSKSALIQLENDKQIKFEIFPKTKEIVKKYGISGYPAFFIIDKEGIIKYSASGYGKGVKELFKKEIEKTLK